MIRVMILMSLAVLSAAVAFADSREGGEGAEDIDTVRVLKICSNYLGKDITRVEPGPRLSITRATEEASRTRVSVPGQESRHMVRVHLTDFPLPITVDLNGNGIDWYRDYDIYIDEEDGKLIKIISTVDGWQDSVGMSSDEVRERDSTLLSKNIRFAGYPDSLKANLAPILQNCPRGPALSAYVSARYIDYYQPPFDSVVPIWVVCLLGAPPWKSVGSGRDVVPRIDYFRIIMDAKTARLISGGNYPKMKR